MSGGKGGSSTSSTKFSKYAKSYITPALNSAQAANAANAGNIQNLTATLQGNLPGVVANMFNNPTTAAAGGYDQDVLSGKYLGAGNPYLNAQIAATNGDVIDGVNGGIGTRGLTGGSAQTQLLARELAKNETALRYQDYTNERNNMGTAATNAGQLAAANGTSLGAGLQYINSLADLPTSDAYKYAGLVGDIMGKQTSTTTQQNPGILQTIGSVAQIASLFSDRRLKRDVEKIDQLPDGLGVYRYRYLWSDEPQTGVMADEVAALRPWALGEPVNGFATVNYGAL